MSANSMRVQALAAAILLAACGGGGDGGQDPPPPPVLTTLEVSPTSATIYNTAPGNTVALTVTGKDENGNPITGVGTPTFASSNTGVATVSISGTVTAVTAGTTQVTVTLQAGGVTKTVTLFVTVRVPPLAAGVSSSPIPVPSYVPAQVHVSPGGDVTWSLSGPEHSVTFVSAGSPTSIASLVNASAWRTFPAAGAFNYKCDFHPTMSGTVYVH